jgi:hypothetical protein
MLTGRPFRHAVCDMLHCKNYVFHLSPKGIYRGLLDGQSDADAYFSGVNLIYGYGYDRQEHT